MSIATSKLREKYTKRHIMDKNKQCNNLGTPRTENWPMILNFLIGQKHAKFNLWCYRLFKKFQLLSLFWVLSMCRMNIVKLGVDI